MPRLVFFGCTTTILFLLVSSLTVPSLAGAPELPSLLPFSFLISPSLGCAPGFYGDCSCTSDVDSLLVLTNNTGFTANCANRVWTITGSGLLHLRNFTWDINTDLINLGAGLNASGATMNFILDRNNASRSGYINIQGPATLRIAFSHVISDWPRTQNVANLTIPFLRFVVNAGFSPTLLEPTLLPQDTSCWQVLPNAVLQSNTSGHMFLNVILSKFCQAQPPPVIPPPPPPPAPAWYFVNAKRRGISESSCATEIATIEATPIVSDARCIPNGRNTTTGQYLSVDCSTGQPVEQSCQFSNCSSSTCASTPNYFQTCSLAGISWRTHACSRTFDPDRSFRRAIQTYYTTQSDCQAERNPSHYLITNLECDISLLRTCPAPGQRDIQAFVCNALSECDRSCDFDSVFATVGVCVQKLLLWEKTSCYEAGVGAQALGDSQMRASAFLFLSLTLYYML